MLRLFLLATALCFLAGALRAADEPSALKAGLDSVFIVLEKDFNKIVDNAALKKSAAGPINRLFFKSLKRRQLYHSLLKTNPKGIGVTEVIRMVEKPVTKKQDFSKEEWFKQVSSSKEPYQDCIFQNETGRYHLFWAAPILKKGKKGKTAFLGAVAVRIDLWDCFHQFAKNMDTPFLVRLGKKNLYSNKWNDASPFGREPLAVPGVQKISVRYPKEGGELPESELASVDSSRLKAVADSARPVKAKPAKSRTGRFLLVLLLLIAIAVAVYKYISSREKSRMDDLDQPPPPPQDGL